MCVAVVGDELDIDPLLLSDPAVAGEQSPSMSQSVAKGEILHVAQDDKIRALNSKARHGQNTSP